MSRRRQTTPTHRMMGRAAPMGPLYGLAETISGVNPTQEKIIYEEDAWGELKVAYRFHKLVKRPMQAKILTIAGIDISRVSESVIQLTPGQRRPARYTVDNKVLLESGIHTDASPQVWEDLSQPGQIVVVRGFVGRNDFRFTPIEWGLARKEKHLPTAVMGPAGGLAVAAAQALN